jgi:hypothetical protein
VIPPSELRSATRPIDPALKAVLAHLKPGQRIRVTQTVRVGQQLWKTTVEGTFRDLNYLATGLACDRADDEPVVVATVHFTKPNGELSSITLDENSRIEPVAG